MRECTHTVGLTYGQSAIYFYMMGLGANFTMREVASSANSYANCHYDIRTHSVGLLKTHTHTVSVGNRL